MLERLPESLRVAICRILRPFVFPVYEFVDRWYYTEKGLRLARVSGTALWWQLRGDEKPGPNDPQTADDVIHAIYEYADRSKPFDWPGKKEPA